MDLGTVALVGMTFLFGGLVKGAIGLGLPVIVLAILAPALGLKAALALFLVPGVVTNIWQALWGPHLKALMRRLWAFLLAAVCGIALGVQVLKGADTALLEALLGVLLIAYSLMSLIAVQLPPPGRREGWMAPLAGASGGVLFGMAGIFIVPGILFLQTLGLKRDMFVQALGLTFLTISSTLAISMGGVGLVSAEQAMLSAGAVVPTALGIWAGVRVRHRISEAGFRRLFFIGLIGAGAFMVWRAVAWGAPG